MTEITLTLKGSGLVPWNTVKASPIIPGRTSDRGMIRVGARSSAGSGRRFGARRRSSGRSSFGGAATEVFRGVAAVRGAAEAEAEGKTADQTSRAVSEVEVHALRKRP